MVLLDKYRRSRYTNPVNTHPHGEGVQLEGVL